MWPVGGLLIVFPGLGRSQSCLRGAAVCIRSLNGHPPATHPGFSTRSLSIAMITENIEMFALYIIFVCFAQCRRYRCDTNTNLHKEGGNLARVRAKTPRFNT